MPKKNLILSFSFYCRKSLNHARRLEFSQDIVEHFSKYDESSLRSFAKFINYMIDLKQTLTLNFIVNVKKNHLLSISGRLSKHACS